MDDWEALSREEVQNAISEELAFVIKKKYNKDIYTMDRKELHDFLTKTLPDKNTMARSLFWWSARHIGEYAVRASIMPVTVFLLKTLLL